ncbi:glycosyltransferase [Vibrio breoganii]|uniref:glycosyltransferase n=1 Tax=Vibrio breoganii TaxID=553239 RepID=UPI000C85CBC6|nr:glycosyltransferase [Vibrio breoganii]PMO35752.1 glycosyl transferase [Vibrio breoganii]
MRIAIAIDRLSTGGAAKVMYSLAQELQNSGHEPHFLLMNDHNVYKDVTSIPVHVCFPGRHRKLNGLLSANAMADVLKEKISDIEKEVGNFHFFLSNLDKTNLLMIKSQVSPLYVVVHASVRAELQRHAKLGPIKYLRKLRAKKALNEQNVITVSEGIEGEIKNIAFINPKTIKTIYNPFNFSEIIEKSNEENKHIPDAEYLIHVGRFVKQKRHDVLFDAISKMKNKLPVVLLVNNEDKVRKLAEKYNVADRVILPGHQTNPYPWIKNAKAMVLSSDFEGLPTVLIESLICGTPIVSTDCPHGPKEILREQLSSYLVPVQDSSALANAVDNILTDNPSIKDMNIVNEVRASNIANIYIEHCK